METKILRELGLTNNEIQVYLFLLKRGETTTGPIIKETNIVNSRVYESLNSLISRGFVTYNLQKDGKHFQASDPKILLEKQKELKEKIETLIPKLSSLKMAEKEGTITSVYEGVNGFKTAFKKMINDCPKNETIHIIGFSKKLHKEESIKLFMTNMNLKSAQKKQKLKVLLGEDVRNTLGKDRKKEKITTVRFLKKGYISPIAVDISVDEVYIMIWEEKPLVIRIKNKNVAESFRMYFNFLWSIARP